MLKRTTNLPIQTLCSHTIGNTCTGPSDPNTKILVSLDNHIVCYLFYRLPLLYSQRPLQQIASFVGRGNIYHPDDASDFSAKLVVYASNSVHFHLHVVVIGQHRMFLLHKYQGRKYSGVVLSILNLILLEQMTHRLLLVGQIALLYLSALLLNHFHKYSVYFYPHAGIMPNSGNSPKSESIRDDQNVISVIWCKFLSTSIS